MASAVVGAITAVAFWYILQKTTGGAEELVGTGEKMSMTMKEQTILRGKRAIVIGAGPAGLAACLGLSPLCESVVLVEKHKTFESLGSTIGLAPNGRKALEELYPGTWDNMTKVGMETPFGGMIVPWWEMRDTLLRQVQSLSNVEMHTGERFVEAESVGDKVKVTFESDLSLEGDILIGADGVHSGVRSWLGLPAASKTGTTVYRGHTIIDSEDNPLFPLLSQGMVPLDGVFQGVFFASFNFDTKSKGKVAWVVSSQVPPEDGMTPMSLLEGKIDDDDTREKVMELLRQSDPSHYKPFPPTSVLQREVLEESWGGKGLVSLVGDAAHAMRPTDGQGASMAFEDAVVLCRAFRRETTIPKALRWFESTRLPRVLRMHADQHDRYARKMRREKVGPWPDDFKQWVFDGV